MTDLVPPTKFRKRDAVVLTPSPAVDALLVAIRVGEDEFFVAAPDAESLMRACRNCGIQWPDFSRAQPVACFAAGYALPVKSADEYASAQPYEPPEPIDTAYDLLRDVLLNYTFETNRALGDRIRHFLARPAIAMPSIGPEQYADMAKRMGEGS